MISIIAITRSSINNIGCFDINKVVHDQPGPDHLNYNNINSVNTQNIPLKKVHVGDIKVD